MKIRNLVIAGLAILFVMGCNRKRKAFTPPPKATPPVAVKQAAMTKKEQKKSETKQEKVKNTKHTPNESSVDVTGKKNLEKCYLELYCAQKHGDMANLLKIYEKYGFKTPKAWTRAYIQAAKDTDWVSELARKASKACKGKK